MASQRQIDANRRNATRSTGPKSRDGRHRSSKNAKQHGFNTPIFFDQSWSAEVEKFVRQIIGERTEPRLCLLARQFAEAQLDLHRIRRYKHGITERITFAHDANRSDDIDQKYLDDMRRIDRYERRAISRRKRAVRELVQIDLLKLAERTQ
jgi:hypothetical protein